MKGERTQPKGAKPRLIFVYYNNKDAFECAKTTYEESGIKHDHTHLAEVYFTDKKEAENWFP